MSATAATHPNFFLVGAPRAGTTSLWQYLRDHPEIHMPSGLAGKEPSFFCDLTPPWATAYRTYEQYLTLFNRAGRCKVIGDASTNYLIAPESAGRIHERYPDSRIVVILRNPVQRAYSVYRFLCFWGLEAATTFEKALALEDERSADEHVDAAAHGRRGDAHPVGELLVGMRSLVEPGQDAELRGLELEHHGPGDASGFPRCQP